MLQHIIFAYLEVIRPCAHSLPLYPFSLFLWTTFLVQEMHPLVYLIVVNKLVLIYVIVNTFGHSDNAQILFYTKNYYNQKYTSIINQRKTNGKGNGLSRRKSIYLWSNYFWQRCKEYPMEKEMPVSYKKSFGAKIIESACEKYTTWVYQYMKIWVHEYMKIKCCWRKYTEINSRYILKYKKYRFSRRKYCTTSLQFEVGSFLREH